MIHDPRYADLLPAYALGALEGDELRELELHLEGGCRQCEDELDQWRRSLTELAEAAPPVAPSELTRARLLRRVAAEPRGVPAPRAERTAPRGWRWAALAATAAAVVFLGWALRLELGAPQARPERDAELARLESERDAGLAAAERARRDADEAREARDGALARADEARNALAQARADLDAARRRALGAESQLAALSLRVEELGSRAATLEASLRDAETELARRSIRLAALESDAAQYRRLGTWLASAAVYPVRLAATDAGSGLAPATAFVDPARSTAALVANLPEPAEGRDYQLWSIGDGAPVSEGIVDVGAGGLAVHWVERVPAVESIHTWAVSLEPAGGSPQPTGPIVLAGAVG